VEEKKLISFLVMLIFAIIWLTPDSVYPLQNQDGSTRTATPKAAENRLIVKLKPEAAKRITLGKFQGQVTTGLAALDSLNLKFKVSKQEKFLRDLKPAQPELKNLSGIFILEVPKGTDLEQMRAEYQRRSEVEYVELDYSLKLYETPNDPLFPHQWWLNNLGIAQNDSQGYYGIDRQEAHKPVLKFGTEDADIDALEAFQRNDYTVVPLVGILDTGVDLDHEDLKAHIWTNPGEIPDNNIDDDHNGLVDDFYGWDFSGDSTLILEDNDPTDTYGHGTHCAGIVAAVRDNGMGISGINTPCRVMAIKLYPYMFHSVCARGIVYAADMGCDIINMSWGGIYPSKLMRDALDYAIYKGVLPIAAAGNDSTEKLNYPAAYDGVFTVGASNSRDQVTAFSTYGDHIEVVAPGEDILSLRGEGTDMYGGDGFPEKHIVDENYYLADGTSMAAPCVVGIAAYILAASPGINVQTVMEIIEQSADDVVFPYGGDSLYSPGKDIYSGYGRVNLNTALQLISRRMAKIDYPPENAFVLGEIAVMGTAAGSNFEGYVLEYGEGLWPKEWTEIASSLVPVMEDTLGIWNSSGLSGLFTLRLTVGEQNQAAVRVIVGNQSYIKITSPGEGDTISGFAEIRGYTIAREFSHYSLEYGYGESPAFWIPITTSTKMVADGILGNWLVSFLNVTDYSLRLSVQITAGEVFADTVMVKIKSIASGGWTQELPSNGSLSPAVGDVDGDGYDEIVVGVGGSLISRKAGGVEVFEHHGQRKPGWPRDVERNMMSSPALGDLDLDGINDIVICSDLGVHAYLSASSDWSVQAGTWASDFWGLATPIIADIEDDGHPEILTIDARGQVYALRWNGQSVIPAASGRFALTAGSTTDMDFPSLAVADLDGDGQKEVIAGAAHPISGEFGNYTGIGGIYIWDINGNPLLEPGDYSFQFVHVFGIALANIDESEDLEILAFAASGSSYALCAMKMNGKQSTGYPIVLKDLIAGWWLGNHPAVGDIDGDGGLETVVSLWTMGEARIYAWHQDGTPVTPEGPLVSLKIPGAETWRETFRILGNSIGEIVSTSENMSEAELSDFGVYIGQEPLASEGETFGSPVLTDINGDSEVEVLIRAGYFFSSGYERLYAWDHQGNLLPGFPLYASAEMSMATYYPYSPVVADADRDGKVNLILGTDFNIYSKAKLISWEIDADYQPDFQPWPKYMHDKWNSGRFDFKSPGDDQINFPPANFHVESRSDTNVTLGWEPKAPWAALGYNVYRATVSGEPGEKRNVELIPQPENQYQDVDLVLGQTYYYTITSVSHQLQEGTRSPELKVTVGGPSAPIQLQADVKQNVVTLTWAANPLEESVQEYLVYHMPPSYEDYYLIGSSVSETTFVDFTIKVIGTHRYQVVAVDSMSLESPPSVAAVAEIALVGIPPFQLKVSSWSEGEVALSWKVAQDGQGCFVYRSLTPGVYGNSPLNLQPIDDPFGPEISYRDSGLTEGVTYYYVVTQVQGDIRTSPSNMVDFLAGRPQTVFNVSSEIRDCHIAVHWNPCSEGDVVGYRIYDGIVYEGDTTFVVYIEDDTIYIDPAVDDSLMHNFWVTAVDSLGLESYLSFYLGGKAAQITGSFYPPTPPTQLKIISHTDTSLTFNFSGYPAQACNIYRSVSSGEYHQPPINPHPVPCVFPQEYFYPFTDMIEGKTYFFNATGVNQNECGIMESKMNAAREIDFIRGVPGPLLGLYAQLDQDCNGEVFWNPSTEGDITNYRAYITLQNASAEAHMYGVTAVDSLGLEGPVRLTDWVPFEPNMPDRLEVAEITDTSVTLGWHRHPANWGDNDPQAIIGARVYRSLVSGHYTGLNPLNDTLIQYDSQGALHYTDIDVQEGITYYYTATNVNACGLESPPYNYTQEPPWNPSLEDTALVGVPHKPKLEVVSSRESIVLHISSSDQDIKGYQILRKFNDTDYQVLNSLYPDTVYVDQRAFLGTDYLYQVTAIDKLDLESPPSQEVEGCLMLFDRGTVLIDLTRGGGSFDGVFGDSVNAFYQRAMEGYNHVYIDRSNRIPLRLIDLSPYPLAIVHSEQESWDGGFPYHLVFEQYLNAGGALLIEGRGVLSSSWEEEYVCFNPKDFRHDYLNMDSAYFPQLWFPTRRNEEFIGAERASGIIGYPQRAELDTYRVNHSHEPVIPGFGGKLPGVGYFLPRESSQAIYTFSSAYDTSAANGKPVALRRVTNHFALIYFGFPLYFVKEEIATQILHTALDELIEFANRTTPYFGYAKSLVNASVYPNPFKPFQGHSRVTFDGLTAYAKIEIFTITGEKVCSIEETDGDGEISWDVTNAQGKKLASGVYIYKITDGRGEEKVSKLAVIR
jgi:fibronectin type 3 domain-containing protein